MPVATVYVDRNDPGSEGFPVQVEVSEGLHQRMLSMYEDLDDMDDDTRNFVAWSIDSELEELAARKINAESVYACGWDIDGD
jgi:hypothetical protein